jgi:hypothetical protein
MEDLSQWSNLEQTALRGDARVAVAEKWANRRKQQEELKQLSSKVTVKKSLPPSSTALPLCVVLRRSWNETMKAFNQQQKKIKPQATKNPQPKPLATPIKRTTFPSVMSILQANALNRQVESFESDGVAMNFLPSDYDFATAVNHMSESRSRAFLLLDFSAIIQTHTAWRKKLPKKGVQMVYSTRHNAGIDLIRLFQRLGVGLRVTTKYDIDRVMETSTSAILWDDCTKLVKPNSFYRRLVLDRSDSLGAAAIPLTVDGTDELERIHQEISVICKRRSRDLPKLRFILRLDIIDTEDWHHRLSALSFRARELQHEVVGVAYDLGETSTKVDSKLDSDTMNLCLDPLSSLVRYVEEQGICTAPQIHLTNPIESSTIDNHVISWIDDHSSQCGLITIDVSRILVANAAALCARIIGVKQIDSSKIHYYIDDGCYGSLSNYSKDGIPLPLKNKRNETGASGENQEGILSTVWGPTCKLVGNRLVRRAIFVQNLIFHLTFSSHYDATSKVTVWTKFAATSSCQSSRGMIG